MKNFTLAFLLTAGILSAQPTIQNGTQVPSPGYTWPVSAAATSSVGQPGANQTWNFSSLTFTTLGTANVISPSSSTMSSSFPGANYAYTFAGTTSFFNVSSSKMEAQAYSITSPGTGNDMSPNPRTTLQFPFNYNDVVIDSWQKVGGAVNTVTLTYDGYGTLMMPSMTYSNVVRVKEDYGNGSDYQWYILSPLMSILVFDHNNNTMYYSAATPTSMKTNITTDADFVAYPNPVTDKFVVSVQSPSVKKYLVTLYNVLAEEIYTASLNNGENELDLSSLMAGTYIYKITGDNKTLKAGRITKTN